MSDSSLLKPSLTKKSFLLSDNESVIESIINLNDINLDGFDFEKKELFLRPVLRRENTYRKQDTLLGKRKKLSSDMYDGI